MKKLWAIDFENLFDMARSNQERDWPTELRQRCRDKMVVVAENLRAEIDGMEEGEKKRKLE